MKWPISRSRFEALQAEHKELRETYERLLDEINFRSTGFHLFPRFAKVDDKPPVQAKPEQRVTLTAMQEAMQGGGPISAVRRRMESVSLADQAAKEFRAQEEIERDRQLRATALMEEALHAGEMQATTQAQRQ